MQGGMRTSRNPLVTVPVLVLHGPPGDAHISRIYGIGHVSIMMPLE